jgi:hypothetical protein
LLALRAREQSVHTTECPEPFLILHSNIVNGYFAGCFIDRSVVLAGIRKEGFALKTRFLAPAFVILSSAGCGGGGGGVSESSAAVGVKPEIVCDASDNIQGCWITSSCDEVVVENSPGATNYGRTIYSFNAAGYLEKESLLYENSDCSGDFTDSFVPETNVTYIVGAPTQASDGTDAIEIAINISIDNREIEFETMFAILDNKQLCTTQSMQLNSVTSTLGDLGDDLDYNQCLERFR